MDWGECEKKKKRSQENFARRGKVLNSLEYDKKLGGERLKKFCEKRDKKNFYYSGESTCLLLERLAIQRKNH